MRPATKIAALAGAIVVAIGAYTAGWFYLAEGLKARAGAFTRELAGSGLQAACDDLRVHGYPFRLGVFCTAISAGDSGTGSSLTAGAFRSAAQVYQPNHIVSELDGPLKLEDGHGASVAARWEVMRSSTVFWDEGLDRADLQGASIDADLSLPGLPAPLKVSASELELHTRRNGNDLEAAIGVEDLALRGGALPARLPVAGLSGLVRFNGLADLLNGGKPLPDHGLRGTAGTIEKVVADIGGGAALTVAGPFSVDGEGRVSGTFDLQVDKLSVWQATIADAVPEAAGTLQAATGMLSALGGNADRVSVTLNVEKGRVSVGLIPIGELPPI